MTASTEQSKRVRRERCIIERPRLIKMLDECEARVILLLAPAGYGKTTLARQWAKTLNGAIWVTLTPAHRDLARFAEDLAAGIDNLGGNASRFIGEYLRARSNPQRAARDIGLALAEQLDAARVQWLIFDDYHDVNESPELAELISVIEDRSQARLLIASRVRPIWAAHRRVLYREVEQIDREDLAMNEDESKLVLGRRPDLDLLVSQAEGWPAVLGLAVGTGRIRLPGGVMPAELYAFIAEELFQSVPETLRQQLLRLALAPELTQDAMSELLGHDGERAIAQAREVGFLSTDQATELHPLVRDFLLQKVSEDAQAQALVRSAVVACVERQRWDRAFELVLRFELKDLVEPVLEAAYKPLARSGHLGTLSAFATSVRASSTDYPIIVDLVDAEVALRDGVYTLAVDLATRVLARLGPGHVLASRANAILGQSAYSQADLVTAEWAYGAAHKTSADDQDEAEALYGWALASVQGEIRDPDPVLRRVELRRHASALDLVRYGTVEVVRRRFDEGLAAPFRLEESIHALTSVEDPRARSSLTFTLAYALALKSEYREALDLAHQAQEEVDAFDLEFARPHSNWNLALIHMGLRRFGAAERCLQLVEDASRQRPLGHHVLNARILRARMALQTGELARAVELGHMPATEVTIPSLHAEFLATRALTCAAAGDRAEAISLAAAAIEQTTAVEVRVMAAAARAVSAEGARRTGECEALFDCAGRLGTWDPVVTALRCSPPLSELAGSLPALRPTLERLYERSNDFALARRAGLRSRSSRTPEELLSPREREVLGLMARGFRNREVATALVISESTTKVHVRHVLEKLGVRTRAEAVARFNLFSA
ncbi:MAG TPA: LuxR C-terminal-related transcriptional regulator [Gaiellaceae bacterium]|nr:LuxR C-terminal-related transcriptional regulator [Gaiellaceae bacterium]